MDIYGTRRKRNIDLSRFRKDESRESNWADELEEGEEIELEVDEGIELEEGYEEYEEDDNELDEDVDANIDKIENEDQPLYLDGKLFVPKFKKRKQTFADTHIRVTTYFEKNIHQIIKILQDQGQIESITKFVNDSIKAHLLNEYSDKTN